MRLKSVPEDFRVRELLEFEEARDGEHYVHLLHKEKLSTPEALALLVRDCDVPRSAIAYAGLKDRQAVTDQYVSIAHRRVELKLPHLRVSCVGRSAIPITSRMSRGNSFTITVRDLRPMEAAHVRRNLPSLQKTGLPNYFDDQRFGCLRHGQGFALLHVLRGDHEGALRRLVAAPSPVAISGDLKLKRALQHRWGDWDACLQVARGPVYQPVFQHLRARPGDFRGALELLPLRQRVIHSFAFQSFLWNRALSRLLRPGVPGSQRLRIHTLAGDLIAWKYLDPGREERLRAMSTPLYGPEGAGGSPPFRKAMATELQEQGLAREDFVRENIPGMIWHEEVREPIVKPGDLAAVQLEPDDMHAGAVKATLSFSLPRGCYATMVLKRLFAGPWFSDRGEQQGGHGRDAQYGGGRVQRFGTSLPLPDVEAAAPAAESEGAFDEDLDNN
jgi:tRNA pseudouridine13 synthase